MKFLVGTGQIANLDTMAHLSSQSSTPFNLQGGYVEFSFLDQTYSHFFTNSKELDYLRTYIQDGKPLEGLRMYIRNYYAPEVLGIELPEKEPIIIWNYEFDQILDS